MFDGKFIEEYKEIKAPDELYSRILNAQEKKTKKSNVVVSRSIASLAAAVAVIISVSFMLFSQNKLPVVYIDGNELSETVTFTDEGENGIMLARFAKDLSCEVNIEFAQATEITALNGLLYSDSGEILLDTDSSMTCDGTFRAVWTVPNADCSFKYSLGFRDNNGFYRIVLYFDSEAECWTAELTK